MRHFSGRCSSRVTALEVSTRKVQNREKMSLYNEDELHTPEWLNGIFLEEILRKYENDQSIQIVSWEITPGSLKGDHYASVMLRAKVEYSSPKVSVNQHKSMIIKAMPWVDGVKRDKLSEYKAFETEISMYKEALPKIEQILAENGDPTRLAPKLIFHALEPHKVIILEDLCDSGYHPVRIGFPTEEAVKAVYTKMAKLHAVSYMLAHSEQHDIVTKYQHGLCSSLLMENKFMTDGIKMFIDVLSAHEEFHEYLPKFKAIEGELFQECKNLYRAYSRGVKDEIFVLNHGDFHTKNLMFKFDEKNQIEDVLMVDYQFSVFAPSVVDMMYSNFMLLSPNLRARRHELLYYYFEQFRKTLKMIKFSGEMPKFSNFQIATIKYRHFSIFLLTTFLPMIEIILTGDPEKFKDLDADKLFTGDDDLMSTIYGNPIFLKEIRRLLPIFLHEGYLD